MTIDKRRCCKNCAFYEKTTDECRKSPPTVFPDPDGSINFDAQWPIVSSEDWCGEYKED
jgi:hypothetical protein